MSENSQNESIMKQVADEAQSAAVSEVSTLNTMFTNMENMSMEQVLEAIPTLIEQVEFNYFQLGGYLSAINAHEWYKTQGYENLKTFVEGHFGFAYRKAMYLISIYDHLIQAEIEWELVKDIGWSKLKELAEILTKDNVASWVEKAKVMTVLQLNAEVAKAKAGTLVTGGTPDTSTPVSTMTFKVHQDQKDTIQMALEKAMKEADTKYPAVALEGICMGYVNGGSVPQSAEAVFKGLGYEGVLTLFEKIWPKIGITVSMPE